jgi:hypothetical protein
MAVIWTPAVYVEVEANSQGGALGKASGPTCRREKNHRGGGGRGIARWRVQVRRNFVAPSGCLIFSLCSWERLRYLYGLLFSFMCI